jgi:oligoendopeptidase F
MVLKKKKNTKKTSQDLKKEWDMTLLYSGDADPRIEKDMEEMEKNCALFEKKYRKSAYTKTPDALKKALDNYENLMDICADAKPLYYYGLRLDISSEDKSARANIILLQERYTKAFSRLEFFTLRIASLPKKEKEKFLQTKTLSHYFFFLKDIFEDAPHYLSEKEECLVDLLSRTSTSAWEEMTGKILNAEEIVHKGKKYPINEIIGTIPSMKDEDRQKAYKSVYKTLKNVSSYAEGEINALFSFKKVMDEKRGYATPEEATISSYDNDKEVVSLLVKNVSSSFPLAHRFYHLHKKLLGKKYLTGADRSVGIGKIKRTFSFEESVEITHSALLSVKKDYADIFTSYLEKGQIDVSPRKGKAGGAYCTASTKEPIFVLLNHTNDVRSLFTLAHEMGHSIHSERSNKTQRPLYKHYSTTTAETVSTFFEQVMYDALFPLLNEREKKILLHQKLLDTCATVFRQIACFNFEKDLHQKIRKEGFVEKEDIANLLSFHLSSYLGDAYRIHKDDGYSFVSWSHIRNFFYVYTYAYGLLVSRDIFERYKKDISFVEKFDTFLTLGGSKTPEESYKVLGIDVKEENFFTHSLSLVEKEIDDFEKMYLYDEK